MDLTGAAKTGHKESRCRGTVLCIVACVGAFIMTVVPRPAVAQINTGTVLGTVTDPTGAAIPGAQVTITNLDTAVSQRGIVTDSTGNYIVPYLIPGMYEVTAGKEGFKKTTRTGITLQVDQKARVDLELQLGLVTQNVRVTGEAPLVNTQTSEVGEVINAKQIVGLPLNVRNFTVLMSLNPGALPSPTTSGGTISASNPGAISDTNVNGIPVDGNNWQLDGVTNNEALMNILSVSPSIDAIQEFKVTNDNYSAELGRAGGASVEIQIKNGTDQFHGVGFEFLRNSSLDANDFFSNSNGSPIPAFRQNQFGGNFGGPIKKGRTFFFGDYEGFRSRLGQVGLQTVPTALQRQGIFTEPGNATIYNPFDIDPVTGQPLPFQNNTIPTSMINSTSANIMGLLPLPNLPNVPIGQVNHIGVSSQAHDVNNLDGRVDHRLSDNDQFFIRYSYLGALLDNPAWLGPIVGGHPYPAAETNARSQNIVISEVHSFSPRTINEFRFGFDRWTDNIEPYDSTLKTDDQVGIPGVNSFNSFSGGLSRIVISGLDSFGHTDYSPDITHDTVFQWVDNVTFIRGRHTVKTGVDFRRIRADAFGTQESDGQFSFDGRFTSNPVTGNGGAGLGSFLLGYPESVERTFMTDFPANRNYQFALFGQDDYRINQKLTVNIGLRWEEYTAPTDAHNNEDRFDYTTGDDLLACIATSCSAGLKTDHRDWGPRVGFAYSPDKSKTSVRGGFGMSYFMSGYGSQIGTANNNWPFGQWQTIQPANPNLLDSVNDRTIDQGVPAPGPVENRPGAPPGHLVPGGLTPGGPPVTLYAIPDDNRAQSVLQWSLDVQRSIKSNLMIDASYVGNRANHLYITVPQNYPEPGVVTANPSLSLQQLRPFYSLDPGLGGFNSYQNSARSHYDAFQLKIEKRFSHGLTLLSSYTASKTLVRGYQYINPDSFLADQAPQAFDTPQRLVVSYIYQLPFGRGKHFGSDQNRWVNGAFGGWSVSGITTYMTGFPFTPSMGSNLDNGNSNNPNRICNGRLSSRTINTYYDTSCFTSTLPPNVFGNSGFGVLRGPGYRDWDLGLMKDFPLGRESRYLQFRAEFFNLPNNVNWGAPNSYECGGGCGEGTITSLAPGSIPREIQFGLKLYF